MIQPHPNVEVTHSSATGRYLFKQKVPAFLRPAIYCKGAARRHRQPSNPESSAPNDNKTLSTNAKKGKDNS